MRVVWCCEFMMSESIDLRMLYCVGGHVGVLYSVHGFGACIEHQLKQNIRNCIPCYDILIFKKIIYHTLLIVV
jgi:hypothetical protein